MFTSQDHVLFLLHDELVPPEKYPDVVAGVKASGFTRVLLANTLLMEPRFELIIGGLRKAGIACGAHFWGGSPLDPQIARATKLRCVWWGYCDGCEQLPSVEAVRDYISRVREAVTAYGRRPALVQASALALVEDLVTGIGTADQGSRPLVPYVQERIAWLDASRLIWGGSRTLRREIGWVGPYVPGPWTPVQDYSTSEWGWLIETARATGYPLTVRLPLEYVARQSFRIG